MENDLVHFTTTLTGLTEEQPLESLKLVFLPTVEFMFSVFIFLRFGFVLYSCGLLLSHGLVLGISLLVGATLYSVTAIYSNNLSLTRLTDILVGTLGTGLGTVLAILYYFGNAVFSIIELLGSSQLLLEFINKDPRILTALLLVIVVLVSVNERVSLAVSIVMSVALVGSIALACFGIKVSRLNFQENLFPMANLDISLVLQVLFPCFVGILTGLNNSATLSNPLDSVSKGGKYAILFAFCCYSLLFTLISFGFSRKELQSEYILLSNSKLTTVLVILVGITSGLQCIRNSKKVLIEIAKLNNYQASESMVLATVLFTCLPFTLFTSLETVGMIVSIIFLTSYFLLNVACMTLALGPSWRCAFNYRYTVSLVGSLSSILVMILISPILTFAIIFLVFFAGILIQIKSEQYNWGSSIESLLFPITIQYLMDQDRKHAVHSTGSGLFSSDFLERIYDFNWRPQFLCFADEENLNSKLFSIMSQLKGGLGIIVLITRSTEPKKELLDSIMQMENIRGFSRVVYAENPIEAKKIVIQSLGFGSLEPNTVLLELSSQITSIWTEIRLSGKNMLLVKGVERFPPSFIQMHRNLDMWWTSGNSQELVPFISLLQQSRVWCNCPFRVFAVVENDSLSETVISNIQMALQVMQISFQSVSVVHVQPNSSWKQAIESNSSNLTTDLVLLAFAQPDYELLKDVTESIFRAL